MEDLNSFSNFKPKNYSLLNLVSNLKRQIPSFKKGSFRHVIKTLEMASGFFLKMSAEVISFYLIDTSINQLHMVTVFGKSCN